MVFHRRLNCTEESLHLQRGSILVQDDWGRHVPEGSWAGDTVMLGTISKWPPTEEPAVEGGVPLLLCTCFTYSFWSGNPGIPSRGERLFPSWLQKPFLQRKGIDQSHAVSKTFGFLLKSLEMTIKELLALGPSLMSTRKIRSEDSRVS